MLKYDFHIADNAETPHSTVFRIADGRTVATFDADEFDLDTAEAIAEVLNERAEQR